jgi:hypothetical protein
MRQGWDLPHSFRSLLFPSCISASRSRDLAQLRAGGGDRGLDLYCTHVMLGDRLAARLPTLDLDDKKFDRPEAVSTRQHAHNNNARMLATKRAFLVGCLRRYSHAIAITAATITSAAAVDLPEISLLNTLLLEDEGGIAFGDLTFWNRPLLGTAIAIAVDCQFLNRDGEKVDQRTLTVEGPVYGRTIKTDDGLHGSRLQMGELATITGWRSGCDEE